MLAVAGDETDRGLAASRGETERLCVATRRILPIEEMIRFVGAPDGSIVADLERKLPGRGAWILATRKALESAIAEKAFARSFKGKFSPAQDLSRQVEALLEKSALASLSMANKAGTVVTGFSKIEKALLQGDVGLLVHASDASPDGVRKLDQIAENVAIPALRRISPFHGEQLDLALGRSNVVHAALLTHPVSTAFLARCLKLDHWRNGGLDGGEPASGMV